MNNRLKFLCIVLALIYIYMIGYAVGKPIYNIVNKNKTESTSTRNQKTLGEHYYNVSVNIKPKVIADLNSKPIINQISGKPLDIEINNARATIFIEIDSLSTWLWIVFAIQIFFMLGVMFFVSYIPIQTFKIIKSVIKNYIFDNKNIKRIQRIGYSALFIFLGVYFYFEVDEQIARKFISMNEYDIRSYNNNSVLLLFSIVMLIFAEILKISQKMKEEQDLTI